MCLQYKMFLIFSIVFTLTGKNDYANKGLEGGLREDTRPQDDAVCTHVMGVDIRSIPQQAELPQWVRSYGTITCGLETMRQAWGQLDHVFSVTEHEDYLHSIQDKGGECKVIRGTRCPKNTLKKYPVDMLVVDRGHIRRPQRHHDAEFWETLVAECPTSSRPKLVVESWVGHSVAWIDGPTDKGSRVRWQALGYESHFRCVTSTQVGGAIQQERLLVVRILAEEVANWTWAEFHPTADDRPMSNLLRPDGLVPHQKWKNPPDGVKIWDLTDPMPDSWHGWVRTKKGVRQLLPEEIGKGLGCTITDNLPTDANSYRSTTSVFHWEYLSTCFV
jgi:hypothetical protein